MKRIITAIVIILILLVSTTFTALSWWNKNYETVYDETLKLGYGVRLALYDQTPNEEGILVPSGSYHASREGYVTSYEAVYDVYVEGNEEILDLTFSLNNLKVGGLDYDTSPNIHGPLMINVVTSKGNFDTGNQTKNISDVSNSFLIRNAMENVNVTTITITFTLLSVDTT